MTLHEVNQRVAAILLMVSVVAVNTFPFFIRLSSSAEVVFMALGAIHAELCLICAWWLCYEGASRLERCLWSVLGFFAAGLAGTALLCGYFVRVGKFSPSTVGLMAVIPAGCIFLGFFFANKTFRGLRLTKGSRTTFRAGQMPLSRLCLFVAACGYVSLLVRQLLTPPWTGWRLESDADAYLLAGMQSAVGGLLAAPCALVVLKPNRFSVLWLAYFIGICALEPLAQWTIAARLRIGGNNPSVNWPESYTSVVIDNLTWYGPQVIPTALLFVLLRWSGARVAEKEPMIS